MTDNKAKDAKELRKQLRRDRISGKHNDGTLNKEITSSRDGAKYSSDEQVSSFERLDEIQAKSTDLVTEARVRTDQREAKRRDVEEEDNRKREELLKHVHDSRHDDDVASR